MTTAEETEDARLLVCEQADDALLDDLKQALKRAEEQGIDIYGPEITTKDLVGAVLIPVALLAGVIAGVVFWRRRRRSKA